MPASQLHLPNEIQKSQLSLSGAKLTMQDFFTQLHDGAKDPEAPVLYLSSQNGNIRGANSDSESEYSPLLQDVGEGPAWAKEVFGQSGCWHDERGLMSDVGESAEATNLWIGDFRSVTSMHKVRKSLCRTTKRLADPF